MMQTGCQILFSFLTSVDRRVAPVIERIQPVLRRAAVLVMGLLLLLLAGYYLIMPALRTPWYDEMFFVDPAAFLADGEGFRSNVWPPALGRPYAYNYPLYTFVLAALIRVFGFSFWLIRYFSCLCVLGSIAGFIYWLRRRGWCRTPPTIAGTLLLVGIAPTIYYAATQARPEALGFPLFLLLLAVFCGGKQRAHAGRLAAISAVSMLIPWYSPHMLIPAGIALAGVWFFCGYPWQRMLAAFAGMVAGLIFLIAFYKHIGAWEVFQEQAVAFAMTSGGTRPLATLVKKLRMFWPRGNARWLFRLHPLLLWEALIYIGLLAAARKLEVPAATRRLLGVVLAANLLAVLALALLTNYWDHYSWFFYLSLAPGLIFLLACFSRRHPGWAGVLFLSVLAFAVEDGIAFAKHRAHWHDARLIPRATVSPGQLNRFLEGLITEDDIVAANDSAFYSVRRLAKEWLPIRSLTPPEPIPPPKPTKLVLKPVLDHYERRYSTLDDPLIIAPLNGTARLSISGLLRRLADQSGFQFREITDVSRHPEFSDGFRVFAVIHPAPQEDGE